jgi:anhydro-N-acetylmuramic acid kinase
MRPDRCRFALGIVTSTSGRQVRAALVAARGNGLELRLEVAAAAAREVPRRLVRSFRQLRQTKKRRPADAAVLAAELAEIKAVLVDDLFSVVPQFAGRALVIGELEPGLWARPRGGLVGYLPLSDPARLADLTGLNVIDAFPARDLAQEGRGGPLGALPDWLLLHHASKTRVLVDLGPSVRLTYLPASRDASGAQRITSFVAGPGMKLVDRFARQLTANEQPFDLGGHLAVQGQRIDELLAAWLADSELAGPIGFPRRVSRFPIGRFVKSGLEQSVGSWSVRDLLCTSAYLVAEVVRRSIERRLPTEPAIDEIVVTGGGQHHGLLMKELAERMAPVPILRESDLGLPPHARDGAMAATLALLHLDETPACPTAITGAQTPRVLGRLTPGSPQAWQRMLHTIAMRAPSAVSLRSAI